MVKAQDDESRLRLQRRRSRLRGLLLKRSGPDEDGSGGSSEEDEIQGEEILSWRGLPIRETDALLNTETLVA